MGNCCANESKAQIEQQERIKRENEREEAKRQLDEGLKNMANGGHQMLSSFTAPYKFTPVANRNYFKFGWPATGSVPVTSFGVRVVAQGSNVEFVEGLANYAVFTMSWKPFTGPASSGANSSSAASPSASAEANPYEITLDQYHSVDANTGEQTPVNTAPKKFLVNGSTGTFMRVLNVEELVDEAVTLAVVAAGADKTPTQKEELRRLLLQQRDVMIQGVVDDIQLMWRCFVEMWTHEEKDAGVTENIWGTTCARRKRVVQSEQVENKKTLDAFYDQLFQNVNQTNPSILRPQVTLDKAIQLQVYNALYTIDGIRCHQTSFRKYTESQITIQNLTSCRAEFEGKRFVMGWPDIPELSSRAYMVSLFSEYASVGGFFHDRMTERYSGQSVGGDDRVNMLQHLISHPFVTEPNDSVVIADQTKQKIAGMTLLASGAHAMFSGLSPPIRYAPKAPANTYYRFQWPAEGMTKVCALGFTIKIVDSDVAFTQGLGTFIMFDVKWSVLNEEKRAKYNVAEGSVEIYLENNVLINAQSGTEEPLAEPVKHLLVSKDGDLIDIINMEELVEFAISSAIAAKGPSISEEEKQQYRTMLIATQKETLTKAVKCDLSFIWASWVQLWTHQTASASAERDSVNFGLATVELSETHSATAAENKATVEGLLQSVISSSAASGGDGAAAAGASALDAKQIQVDVAKQEESYKTLFERDTVRPFVASYQKVTETNLSLHVESPDASKPASSSSSSPILNQIHLKEYKNSRHVFIWAEIPQLSSKEYIQRIYQDYLDLANSMYSNLKAENAVRK